MIENEDGDPYISNVICELVYTWEFVFSLMVIVLIWHNQMAEVKLTRLGFDITMI